MLKQRAVLRAFMKRKLGWAILFGGIALFVYASGSYVLAQAPACEGSVYGNYCGLRGLGALLPMGLGVILLAVGGLLLWSARAEAVQRGR